MATPGNPYIAGKALGQEHGFFGRADILDLVETEMRSQDRNAVVLFGQRRIGKTSILLQLSRRLRDPLVPVYFDLMDRAHRPLGTVLFEWARKIFPRGPLRRQQFDDEGLFFRKEFLPAYYQTLAEGQRPVLLLDEFDVFDRADDLPESTAARTFFPFLRQLMEGEPRLGFVFVVGRRAEDLSIDARATFKAARYKRVSVLDRDSANDLVRWAERQGTLRFAAGAVERVLELTAGHPYLTQLTCQILWDQAQRERARAPIAEAQPVSDAAVDAALPQILEAGENVFQWIWAGLPPAERVLFATIAAFGQQAPLGEEELRELLQRNGIRYMTRELEVAPETLVTWEMLRHVEGRYSFFVEMLRHWVAARKPLTLVRDELDRTDPLADRVYQAADGYYARGNLPAARDQLIEALRVNPNHLKARLRLGQVLAQQGKLADAVTELEDAYRRDDRAAQSALVQALLLRGQELEKAAPASLGPARACYERVRAIAPRERVAQERLKEIWQREGESAILRDDLEAAEDAYRKAGDSTRLNGVIAKRQQRALEAQEEEARLKEADGEFLDAQTLYLRLLSEPGVNTLQRERWRGASQRCGSEHALQAWYREGVSAYQRGAWAAAANALSRVVEQRPKYLDSAVLLTRARARQFGRWSLLLAYPTHLLCLILLLVLAGAGIGKYRSVRSVGDSARVPWQLRSHPTGAAVCLFKGGRELPLGRTPLLRQPEVLHRGQEPVTLHLRLPGYVPVQVQAAPGVPFKRHEVLQRLPAQLLTTPAGAVVVDLATQQELGRTPLESAAQGSLTVELRRSGYDREQVRWPRRPGESLSIRLRPLFELDPRPVALRPAAPAPRCRRADAACLPLELDAVWRGIFAETLSGGALRLCEGEQLDLRSQGAGFQRESKIRYDADAEQFLYRLLGIINRSGALHNPPKTVRLRCP